MFRKITCLLAVTITINASYAKQLSDNERKKYSDTKTFEEICFAPDKASKSPISKHQFHILYNGKSQKLSNNFQKILSDRYIQINTNITSSIPFIIVFKEKDKYLYEKFEKLATDTTVTIYGTLRHKSIKKEVTYYFIIDDVEVFKSQSITIEEFKKDNYINVTPAEFKVKFTEYLDKKVAISLYPKEIINRINPIYQKLAGITIEEFYIINAVIIKEFDKLPPEGQDTEGFGIDVIAARANSNITDSILAAPNNADFIFYGTLKKLVNPTQQQSKPVYSFFLDAITEK